MKKENKKQPEQLSFGFYENFQEQFRIDPKTEKQIITGKMSGDEIVAATYE